jgi:hypothetical protein
MSANTMNNCNSTINIIVETPRMQSGSTLYLPSMYDSDDEEDDTFSVTIYETRDDHIKKHREDDQQRRGSRYALLRSLAWSQDEEADETSEYRMEYPSTDDPAVLCTAIGGICTTPPPPASEETKNNRATGGSSILWEQQVPSGRDLGAIVCQREKC